MKTVFSYSLVVLLLLNCVALKAGRAGDDGRLGDAFRLALSAGANEDDLDRLLAAAERHHVRNEYTLRWMDRIRNAAEEGLPAGPLIGKIEEGLTKNIETERIDTAIERVVNGLRFTNDLLAENSVELPGPASTEHRRVLIRMSELLSAGVTETEMSNLYQTWKPAPVRQKLEALTFYAVAKQAGLTPGEAVRIASAGIEHNHFHSFPLELAMMIKAAVANHIETAEIVNHALKVIRGEQTVTQAHRQMGILQMRPNPGRGYQSGSGNPGFRGSDSNGGRSGGSGGGHGGGHGGGGRGR